MKAIIRVSLLLSAGLLVFAAGEVDAAPAMCGDSFDSVWAVALGLYEEGPLEAGESCYVRLDIQDGYEIQIDYDVETENFFGHVTLYDEDENELVGSDESSADLRWLNSGIEISSYYIVIENSYQTDFFTVQIDSTDKTDAKTGSDAGGGFSEAAEIEYGEYEGYLSNIVYGTVGGNDEYDYYKLSVSRGDTVVVNVTPDNDFFAGCAVYDSSRSELFNEEGLEKAGGEMIQESIEISQDGYIYIVVKWPTFGGFDSSIEPYYLSVTNQTAEEFGGEVVNNEDAADQEVVAKSNDGGDMDVKKLMIIGASVALVVFIIVLIVLVISSVTKKNRSRSEVSSSPGKSEDEAGDILVSDEKSTIKDTGTSETVKL